VAPGRGTAIDVRGAPPVLNRINSAAQLRERTACNLAAPSADFDRFVQGLLEPSAEDVVLDLGPGLGRQMIPLAGTVRHIVGLDRSPEMTAVLRAQLPGAGVEVVDGDMDDLAALGGERRFTLAYSVYSLYYSTRPAGVVEAVARRLAGPGARFVVVAPDVGNNDAWFRDLGALYRVPDDVLEVPRICRSVVLPAFLDTFPRVACATFWSTIRFRTVEALMRYYDACAPYCRTDRRADALAYFAARVARDGGYRILKRSLGLVGRP
jgi:SAM-dependent methyltransferase